MLRVSGGALEGVGVTDYTIEMLWQCSVCQHRGNRGLKDRYCCNCGHKKDESDGEYMPADMTRAAALSGDEDRKAKAGADWVCKYCESNQNQLNKCCGNCGGDRDGTRLVSPLQAETIAAEVREDFQAAKQEAERIGRELDAWSEKQARRTTAPVAFDADELRPARKPVKLWAAIAAAVLLCVWFLVWLFSPREVTAQVSQLSWQHDTVVDRYQIQRREGWSAPLDAVEVTPLGMRHHHYDRVHVGSHQEAYSESYACGQTCSTSPSSTSCSSNANGTATCRTTPGSTSCSTRYCTRTAYRTVQDYKNVSRPQMWFAWRVWDWGRHRTIPRSGTSLETAWPSDADLKAPLAPGEKERSHREASYRVTFAEGEDTWNIRPKSLVEFQRFPRGKSVRLKVNRVGSVEVLP